MDKAEYIFIRRDSDDLKYSVQFKTIAAAYILKYMLPTKFNNLCRIGCPNYGGKWSCPPYSPTYEGVYAGYEYLTVCLLSINLNQFNYIKNNYLKVKAANVILKSRVDRLLRKISAEEDYKTISTGSCRLCKPCRCKMGRECKKPNIMAYSFEALGIDVGAITEDIFDYSLMWYQKKRLPKETSVVAGLLSEELIDHRKLLGELIKFN